VEGAARARLEPGDLALVPHGEGHRLLSEPGTPPARLPDLHHEQVSERYAVLHYGGGGEASSLICGVVRFDHPAASYLSAALPKLILLKAEGAGRMDWLQNTLSFMAEEARELRPGGETVITRLADILVIQAIRSWIAQDPAAQGGWLGALRDRRIGRAIACLHREPERGWTVAALAQEAAMSRSAFAARFAELVGESPMHYVARWRMHVALSWLREPQGRSLGQMAEQLGYQSEAAFHRAFKRVIGRSPGSARQSLVLVSR
jgi:AraC-like DNA-binding protein